MTPFMATNNETMIMISISPIEIFSDNYVWLIVHQNNTACVVDPGDAAPVQQVLQAQGLTLTAILITHHHWDHTGGIDDLVKSYPDVCIYGPNSEKIPQITHAQKSSDNIDIFGDSSLCLEVIEVPGHTSEHIAYYGHYQTDPNKDREAVLFSGDTLFAGGCGRLLGGTAEQLLSSLKTLAKLPGDTRVYCTHEYTLANLEFAATVEPNNTHITQRIAAESQKRKNAKPTLPSSLELEQRTNPFLRCIQPEISQSINKHWGQSWQGEQELFTALRRWKDNF